MVSMKFKKMLLSSILVVATLMSVACGKTGDSKSADGSSDGEKVFRIGCEATTPGWIQTNKSGKLEGYDYDVWQEIGKRTGYKIDFKVMDWDGMWPMIEDNRLDTVAEQISINEEREKKYCFTEPYAYNYYCLLSAKNNEKLKTINDLKSGMTISCETNSSDEVIVNKIDKEFNVKLKPMYYSGMSVKDVALGRCDLWPRAETSCILTVKEVDNLKILGKTNIIETNAYPFAKNEKGKKLAEVASKAIKEMKEDGTLKKLSEKWFEVDITENPEQK